MFLNETKPPLDEALEHFGVLGMHWGRRKGRDYEVPPEEYQVPPGFYNDQFLEPDRKQHHVGRNLALGAAALVGVGAVASVMVLKNHGSLPVYKIPKYKSPFAGRTFRPENVGNPIWKVNPKTPRAARDFVDAGFGKGGVFNVTTMQRGAKTVNDFGPKVWDVPMQALPRGRR